MQTWVKEARDTRGEDVKIVLLGNKSDLEEKRQVSVSEGENMAKELRIFFFETSAKLGTNVSTAFLTIASMLPGLENVDIPSPESN